MRFALFALALPVVLAPLSARAQGTTAEDLFHEGVSLFGRGEVAAACERFERSYKLDAAPGTLFNLANCHEKQGKLWQARGDFLDLVERATAAGKLDKAQLARDRLVAVEAKLPKLSFVFVPQSNATSISIDDAPLADSAWHSPVPVDVGPHVIDFRAPGRAGVKRSVATPGVSLVHVQVPSLVPETAPVAVAAPADAAPPVSAVVPAPLSPPPAAPAPVTASPSGVRAPVVVGYVLGGLGLVGLGVGTYFAVTAVSQHNQAATDCMDTGNGCANATDTMNAKNDSSNSNTSAIEAGVAFGIGVVAVASGIALIATGSSRAPASSTSFLVIPTFGHGTSGMALSGRF